MSQRSPAIIPSQNHVITMHARQGPSMLYVHKLPVMHSTRIEAEINKEGNNVILSVDVCPGSPDTNWSVEWVPPWRPCELRDRDPNRASHPLDSLIAFNSIGARQFELIKLTSAAPSSPHSTILPTFVRELPALTAAPHNMGPHGTYHSEYHHRNVVR